ncbi:MAG TPA: GNAT family N-acetyltransferase [Miltoncostaeaceae bacterium]|nr:GNAT family N-acetyltransferase [Miltoncostaeaceae bacterium]
MEPPALTPPDPPLAGEGFLLRPPAAHDVPGMVAACNDPEIPRWTTVPTPYTAEDARAFLEEVARGWREGTGGVFAVADRADDGILGMIGLNRVATRIAVVGYWVAPWARNRGLATAALRLVTDWGLDACGLDRVDLATLPGNRASERVALKAGYAGGEIVPYGFVHNGQRRDVRVWSRARG